MHEDDLSSLQLLVDEVYVQNRYLEPRVVHKSKRGKVYYLGAPHHVIFKISRVDERHHRQYNYCTEIPALLRRVNAQGTVVLLEPLEVFELQLRQSLDKWPLQRYSFFLYDHWHSDTFDWMWERRGHITTLTYKRFVAFLCMLLYSLRRAQCIHGDIKLENILISTNLHFVLTDVEGIALESEHATWCAGRGTKTYLHPTCKTRPGPRYIDDAYAAGRCLLKFITLDFSIVSAQQLSLTTVARRLNASRRDAFVHFVWDDVLPAFQNILHAPSLQDLQMLAQRAADFLPSD